MENQRYIIKIETLPGGRGGQYSYLEAAIFEDDGNGNAKFEDPGVEQLQYMRNGSTTPFRIRTLYPTYSMKI